MPQFPPLQHPDPHHLTCQLLAALVANIEHDEIFAGLGGDLVRNTAVEAQRAIAFVDPRLGGIGAEAQMVAAPRADRRGFQDGRLAVRADAGGPRRTRAQAAHTERGVPLNSTAPSLSSQPNSTCPRMREPAATVMDAALTSPTMTPVLSTSTCLAASILPCSSPPTTTTPARTWPSSRAPASMRKLPSTCTSPLKRPAMRTSPEPVIFPSMVSSAAMTDSTVAARGEALRRLVSAAAGAAPLGNSVAVVVGVPGAGVPPPVGPGVEPGSFQSAMSRSSYR